MNSKSITSNLPHFDVRRCKIATVYYFDHRFDDKGDETVREYYAVCSGHDHDLFAITKEYAEECVTESGWKGPLPVPVILPPTKKRDA